MAEPEEIDDDLFADLYDEDEALKQAEDSTKFKAPFEIPNANGDRLEFEANANKTVGSTSLDESKPSPENPITTQEPHQAESPETSALQVATSNENDIENEETESASEIHGIGIKEDGKMFIGGLNWETTDQSLKDYFSQFGEVQECTVMRDAASGRSRGFGFLTFKDPKTVNIVMVKEHFLDGKIIDPKRAIPRDEQERTSKIFVGGVSQEASEQDFKEYFMQYGRVVDATLMMDKDTGRPRGFGFVTFDSEAAVDATLQGDLMILGKPIEVKKAQPRGNIREEEERDRRSRRPGKEERFRDDYAGSGFHLQGQSQNQSNQGFAGGMSPQMAAQYWQRMQQFMSHFMAAAQGGALANSMVMGGMNPAAMQQMKQMQAMQQMQQMQQMQAGRQHGSQSPSTQNAGVQNMQGMAGQMPNSMQIGPSQGGGGSFGGQMNGVPTGPSMNSGGGRRGTPGYNAQEQLMFEQKKYEQQARRITQDPQQMSYQHGGPTSWEGMYDDVPQPNLGGHGNPSHGRGGHQSGFNRGSGNLGGNKGSAPKGSSAPANAPTGPKNAGVPGANYRGGGRGGHRNSFHPYRR